MDFKLLGDDLPSKSDSIVEPVSIIFPQLISSTSSSLWVNLNGIAFFMLLITTIVLILVVSYWWIRYLLQSPYHHSAYLAEHTAVDVELTQQSTDSEVDFEILFASKVENLDVTPQSDMPLISENMAPYFDFGYDVLTLVTDLSKSHDFDSYLKSFNTFIRPYHDPHKSVNYLADIVRDTGFSGVFDWYKQIQTVQPQGAREGFNMWKQFKNSEILHKFNRVLFGIVSLGLTGVSKLEFSIGGLRVFSDRFLNSFRVESLSDLAERICELMISFFEVGYECFVSKSLRPLLISNRECRTWLTEYEKLLSDHALIATTDNPDYVAMLCEMERLIDVAQPIIRTSEGQHIKSFLKELSNMKLRFIQKHNVSSRRKAPLSFLIHGPVAIGKTSVTDIIGKVYHRVVTTIPDSDGRFTYPTLNGNFDECMYTYMGTDKFFSGFKGSQHWFLVMDDLARAKDTHIAKGMDDSHLEIINIINSVGYATNQAAVEDKGIIPMLPKLVVGTTNVKNLNAHHAVQDPCAVLRRFPYVIEPIVKDAYRNPGTHTLRTGKEPHKDPWIFKIERAIPYYEGGKGNMKYVPVNGSDGSIYSTIADLCKFIQEVTLKHESDARVMQKVLSNNDAQLCPHGVLDTFPCPECESTLSVCDHSSLEYQSGWALYFLNSFLCPWICTWFLFQYVGANNWLTRRYNEIKWFSSYGRDGLLLWFIWACPPFLLPYLRDFAITTSIASNHHYIQLLKRHYDRLIPKHILAGKLILLGSVSVLALSLAHRFFTKRKVIAQSEEVDPWIRREDFFRVPSVTKAGNRIELENRIKKCMVILDVRDANKKGQKVMAFHYSNQQYITVAHAFSGCGPYQCVARVAKNKFQQATVCPFILTDDMISSNELSDISVFRTASILPRASLKQFIPADVYEHGGKFSLLRWSPGMDMLSTEFLYNKPSSFKWEQCRGDFYKGQSLSEPTQNGDCGGLYIVGTMKGFVIVGMHCAGNVFTNTSVATPISHGRLESLLCDNPMDFLESGDNSYFENGSKNSGKLGEIPLNSVPAWMDPGRCEPIGSFPNRSTHKSHTRETKVAAKLRLLVDVPISYTSPVMTPYAKGDEWINPYTLNANKQNKPSALFKEKDVIDASRSFFQDVLGRMPPIDRKSSVLSMHHTINGIDGSRYIRSLPFSTSGGFHFPGTKRKYFLEDEDGKYACGEELLNKYKDLEEAYSMGRRANALFSGALKDEPVSLEKRAIGKTRLFTASDLPFTLMVRKHFLPIVDLMMTHNIPFECAVGMNCHSYDWVKIFMHITTHGEDRMIAGDFASYDKGMCALVMRGVFFFFEQVREKFFLPLSYREQLMAKGVCTDICYPMTNINGDVIQFYGGNSSGHPLTVMVNSVANSMYMRLAYKLSGHSISTFSSNVSMMSLGDDNVLGSKLDSFNHTTISTTLARYGVKYTMADKKAVSVPFLHISEIDFLKRKFKKLRNTVCAPLAVDSLIRSITIFTDRENVSEEERLAETFETFLNEIALHGEDQFEEWKSIIMTLVEDDKLILHFTSDRMEDSWERTLDRVLPHTKTYL